MDPLKHILGIFEGLAQEMNKPYIGNVTSVQDKFITAKLYKKHEMPRVVKLDRNYFPDNVQVDQKFKYQTTAMQIDIDGDITDRFIDRLEML